MKKTTKKTAPVGPTTLKFHSAPDSEIHIPRAFKFVKGQYYGMTALLTPIAITSGEPQYGPLVAFKVGLAFCSPQDTYNGKKGVAMAAHRMITYRSFELLVPLKDVCRPSGIEKAIMKQIDVMFPDYVNPVGLEGAAADYGFPTRLLYYRHAHRQTRNFTVQVSTIVEKPLGKGEAQTWIHTGTPVMSKSVQRRMAIMNKKEVSR